MSVRTALRISRFFSIALIIGCRSSGPSRDASAENSDSPKTSLSLADSSHGKRIEDNWQACHPSSRSKAGTELDSLPGFVTGVDETYDLMSVGGRELPIVLKTGPSAKFLSQTITLHTDGTYRSIKTYRFRQGRFLTTRANAEMGQYRQDKDYTVIAGRRWLCATLKRTDGGRGLTGGEEVPPHGGSGAGQDFVYTRRP